MTAKLKPWSDEELALVMQKGMSDSELALLLDRSIPSIRARRQRTKQGSGVREDYWTSSDMEFLRAEAGTLSFAEVAARIGKTESSVAHRASRAGIKAGGSAPFRRSPHHPGARTVLARTCLGCGMLLPGRWFFTQPTPAGRKPVIRCKKCQMQANPASRERVRSGLDRLHRYQKMAQKLTEVVAEKNGEPWTEQDFQVLKDPKATVLEKALRLKRTYQATRRAVNLNGVSAKAPIGDPYKERWLIENPNEPRVQEILAAIREGVEAGTLPRPDYEWDWDDEDLRQASRAVS